MAASRTLPDSMPGSLDCNARELQSPGYSVDAICLNSSSASRSTGSGIPVPPYCDACWPALLGVEEVRWGFFWFENSRRRVASEPRVLACDCKCGKYNYFFDVPGG